MGSVTKYPATGLANEVKAPKKNYQIRNAVWLESEMFYSKAFRSLSAKGIWVLMRFYQKRKWNNVGRGKKAKNVYTTNNLVFTYDEAQWFGISQSSFHDIIKKLVELGFIDVEHQGGCYGRDYSRYAISDRWEKYGQAAFVKVEKKRVLQPGLDVRSRMKKLKKATESHSVPSTETHSCEHLSLAVGY